MEYDKINNLLLSEDNESERLSKFVTREYVRVNSLSSLNDLIFLPLFFLILFYYLFSLLYSAYYLI